MSSVASLTYNMMRSKHIFSGTLTQTLFFRSFNSKPVRVRFAPSPTGYLHLGGLRTALYNYFFALSKNGKMILRIEDTDQSRKVEGAVETLIDNLEWAGVMCHEGPTQGGNHGPYTQSERCDIYKKEIDKLLSNNSAYKCFCTDRRIDILRRDALRSRQIPKYDNKCRHLSPEEVKEKVSQGVPYCIRFKLSSDCNHFEDLIYGSIAYDVSQTEGDPVIMKLDGFPTYHFANVVDDHLMEVSHVLRGVEWQISTTKHLLLYKAFGWEPPQYGHLPLIVNSDGSKLSKRQGDIRVDDYRRRGILPAALVNYMSLAGGGFARTPGDGMCAASMQELVSQFQLELVNSSPSRLNPELLIECNRLELMEQLKDPEQAELLVNETQKLIDSHFKGMNLHNSPEHIKKILQWSSGRLTTLHDLLSDDLAFIWILPSSDLILDLSSVDILKKLVVKLENDDESLFQRLSMKESLKEFSQNNDVKYKNLMKTLRCVLSGLEQGPSVAEMMEVLGKNETIGRINAVLKM